MPLEDVFLAGATTTPSPGNSPTILLVDDEEDVRAMCRRSLEFDGYMVIDASNGLDALSLVQEWTGPIDLVITDLKMPRLGGRELAELLSVFRPDLPVLAMTGDPGMADRRVPTLLKPFSPEALTEAASRLMRSRASAMRAWPEEKRARARQARQMAAAMQARHDSLQSRVDLVAIARELQSLGVERTNSIAG
jgi:CheY-like chemotaxis protein